MHYNSLLLLFTRISKSFWIFAWANLAMLRRLYYREVFARGTRFARTLRNLTQWTQRKAAESTEVSVLQAIEMVAGRTHLRMARSLLDEKTFAELVATHKCS